MEIVKFERRPFQVEGVQVTEENMREVAEWCGGDIRRDTVKSGVETYIKVKTHRPLNEKQRRAYVGDWVLKAATGFKVYTQTAMENSFAELSQTRNVFEQNAEAEEAAIVDELIGDLEVTEVGPYGHTFSSFKFVEEEPKD